MEKFKRRFRGVVVSHKMDKTGVLLVRTIKSHSRYKKRIRWSRKVLFHDESNQVEAGDTVEIVESRPMSKRKRFDLSKVLSKASPIEAIDEPVPTDVGDDLNDNEEPKKEDA